MAMRIHTYIHTRFALQSTSVGLAQARPNKWYAPPCIYLGPMLEKGGGFATGIFPEGFPTHIPHISLLWTVCDREIWVSVNLKTFKHNERENVCNLSGLGQS